MTGTETDPERLARVQRLLDAINEIIEDEVIGDIQMAMANAIGRMCLRQSDPEGLFLTTQESLSEVFRAMRKHVRAGGAPQLVEGRSIN